ncbi:MAG TPA: hypothetical protein VEK56_15605 [Vicinamibacterales bacterium]|nr:hypothetical protein [Vicinamibacterales bacterium]
MNTFKSASALPWGSAVGAGVGLAVVFTLSPLTVLTTAAVAMVAVLAGRGLLPSERRILSALLWTAFAARAAAVAVLFLVSDHDSQAAGILFGDEAYTLARALRIRNIVLGIPALKYDYVVAFDEYGRNSYLGFVTSLQLLLGPSPYGLRLVSSLTFLTGAVLLFRLVYRGFGTLPSFLGLTLLLFLPTWFLWSIAVLKEPLYFLFAATALTATVECIRRRGWRRRVLLALLAAGAVFALRNLREGAVVLIVSGLAIGSVLFLLVASARRFVAASAAFAILAAAVLTNASVQQRVLKGLEAAASVHLGHVFTVGQSYKLLDEGFYATLNVHPSLTASEAARFVVRAAISFLVVPLPSQMTMRGLMQLPEHLIWYALVFLAPVGIAAGIARDRLGTAMLVGYTLPTAAVVALTNGNVGTLIRFRGLVTPYLVWFACLGACAVMQRVLVRAHSMHPATPHLHEARDTA